MANANEGAAGVAGELLAAFNAADWPRFRATLADDVVYEEAGTGRRVEGVEAYLQLCQGWKAAFPDATGAARSVLAEGETVAQELEWTGTHTGPLAGPAGPLPASGKRIRVPATLWATVREGKARSIRHHLDVLALLQQIGAPPP
jgi:steroid delta-isomerase-like uncharacterized protein